MPEHYLTRDDIDTSKAKDTGGQTGSVRAELKEGGEYIQYKMPIQEQKQGRRVKAHHTDVENFGEHIAAELVRALCGEDAAPDVPLIQDEKTGLTGVGSRYLTGDMVCSLDDYMRKQGLISKDEKAARHATFVSGPARHPSSKSKLDKLVSLESLDASEPLLGAEVSLDDPKVQAIAPGIARAIAVSMIVGDHDVNPSNLMVTQSGDEAPRVTRIDFGHAFSHLLDAPEKLGGRLRNKNNFVLDFLNRTNVGGIGVHTGGSRLKTGDTSKLWRDYPGFIPSTYLADALEAVSKAQADKIAELQLDGFVELLGNLQSNKNVSQIKHIYKSLLRIHSNIGAKPKCEWKDIKKILNDNKPNKHAIACAQLMDSYKAFCKKNIEDMKQAAAIMKLQVKIDEMIKDNNLGMLDEVKKKYEDLADSNAEFTWIKTYEPGGQKSYHGTLPVRGDLSKYIEVRTKQLQEVHPGIEFTPENSAPAVDQDPAPAEQAGSPAVRVQAQVDAPSPKTPHPLGAPKVARRVNKVLDALNTNETQGKLRVKTGMIRPMTGQSHQFVDDGLSQTITLNDKAHSTIQIADGGRTVIGTGDGRDAARAQLRVFLAANCSNYKEVINYSGDDASRPQPLGLDGEPLVLRLNPVEGRSYNYSLASKIKFVAKSECGFKAEQVVKPTKAGEAPAPPEPPDGEGYEPPAPK